MKSLNHDTAHKHPPAPALLVGLGALLTLALCGCRGYSNESIFPQDVASVRLEMFDNSTFWRDVEYDLSDALAKRIETDTPYKIVTSADRADSVITGRITDIHQIGLTAERELGGLLEKQVEIEAVVTWKDLKTGRMILENQYATAGASYSPFQNQDFRYASRLAANRLAVKIVELMELKW